MYISLLCLSTIYRERFLFISLHVRQSKTVLYSGFHAVDSGIHVFCLC